MYCIYFIRYSMGILNGIFIFPLYMIVSTKKLSKICLKLELQDAKLIHAWLWWRWYSITNVYPDFTWFFFIKEFVNHCCLWYSNNRFGQCVICFVILQIFDSTISHWHWYTKIQYSTIDVHLFMRDDFLLVLIIRFYLYHPRKDIKLNHALFVLQYDPTFIYCSLIVSSWTSPKKLLKRIIHSCKV